MKIVLVHNTYQHPGGEDVVFRNECDLLKNAGHQIFVYQRSNHEVFQYVSVRQLVLAKRTIWASDTRREFRQLLRRCLLYTSPSPRDLSTSRMPSSA